MDPQRPQFRIDHYIVAALMFVMAAIAFINVLSRYIFHFSFAATEEITLNFFVWMTVIGTGLAFERGGQLGMVTLYNVMPRYLRKAVIIFSAILNAGLFLLVVLYVIQAIYDEVTLFHSTSPSLGIPEWIYYSGVPVFSIFVFRGIYRNGMRQLAEQNRMEV